MNKYLPLFPFLFLLPFLIGCTSVKRYHSAIYKGMDQELVDMDLFGAQLVSENVLLADRSLWELSASAQPKLIQILDERYPGNEQFIRTLGKEYRDDQACLLPDLTRKKLKMVFTISKKRDYAMMNVRSGRFSPADRIEYLSFALEIPEEYNLRFTSWNRFSTEYGEIEIADLTFNRKLDLEAESVLGQSDVGSRASLTRNEEQQLRSRYLKLNGKISATRIGIEEEGTREIDLTGNVLADVSLEFTGFPEKIFIPLFSDAGGNRGGMASVSGLRELDVRVPRLEEAPDTLFAILTFEYIYRHVDSGWKTYAEWDDHVEYYSGRVTKEVALFTKGDYLPTFYCIGTETPDADVLKIRKESGEDYLLQFRDYHDSSLFLEWLRSYRHTALPVNENEPISISGMTLIYRGEPVVSGQPAASGMKVMPVYR